MLTAQLLVVGEVHDVCVTCEISTDEELRQRMRVNAVRLSERARALAAVVDVVRIERAGVALAKTIH